MGVPGSGLGKPVSKTTVASQNWVGQLHPNTARVSFLYRIGLACPLPTDIRLCARTESTAKRGARGAALARSAGGDWTSGVAVARRRPSCTRSSYIRGAVKKLLTPRSPAVRPPRFEGGDYPAESAARGRPLEPIWGASTPWSPGSLLGTRTGHSRSVSITVEVAVADAQPS